MTNRLTDSPFGKTAPIGDGQLAFVPQPLPRELSLSSDLVLRLDRASRAVATLSGVGETVPNPHMLSRPFIRREAALSSRIEGTWASLSDVLAHEAGGLTDSTEDTQEVVNYVIALEYGVARLESLPISFRLANELHERLLSGVRGKNMTPGRFRAQQVWIGPPGSSIRAARFIPPPPEYLRDLFLDWELFVNETHNLPPLIRCAMAHYQIEAIHPYMDGNGRIGRLLITLFLRASGVLRTPLLYLSAYFERDRQRYYDELLNMSVTCDWKPWLSYFLDGVYRESQDVLARIRRVRHLQEEWRELLRKRGEPSSGQRLLEELFANPVTTASRVAELLQISDPGARRVLGRLISAGIITRVESRRPNLYVAQRLIDELERPNAPTDN